MDETQLIRLARQGDIQAYNTLILAFQDDAFTLASYLLGDDARSAQAVQAAVIQAYQELRQHKGGSFRAWLLRGVIRHCASNQKGRRNVLSGYMPVDDLGGTLRTGFESLPHECCLALLLVDLLGLDPAEAVYAAGCSPAKLAQLLARGRSHLAASLLSAGV